MAVMTVSLTLSATALADEPLLQMEWFASSDAGTPITFDPADIGDTLFDDDGSVIYTGSLLADNWQLSWTTRARNEANDSWLDGTLSIINLSDNQQDFSLSTTMEPLATFTGPATMDLAASLALTNLQWFGEATVESMINDPLVTGQIDGSTVAGIFGSPYSLQATGGFGSTADSDAIGTESSMTPSQAIAMLTSFTLSAGDMLNISFAMNVTSIPAPGAAALLSLAFIMGGKRGRRRHNLTSRGVE
jgi:hypothetical protein